MVESRSVSGRTNPPIRLHNYLVNAFKSSLTLGEQRLLMYICAFLIHESDERLHNPYRVEVLQYARAYDLSQSSAYDYLLNEISDAIQARKLKIRDDQGRVVDSVVWVPKITHQHRNGFIDVYFHEDMTPYLVGLKSYFTQVGFLDFAALRCKYTFWFLALLAKHQKFGKFNITDENLRQEIGLEPGRYPRYRDFRRNIIEKVEAELIKTKSTLWFSWEVHSMNGRVPKSYTIAIHRRADETQLGIQEPIERRNYLEILQAEGVRIEIAAELVEKHKEDLTYFDWVLPKIRLRKQSAKAKGRAVARHHEYTIKIINEEWPNFRVEKRERAETEARRRQKLDSMEPKQRELIRSYLSKAYDEFIVREAERRYQSASQPLRQQQEQDFQDWINSDDPEISKRVLIVYEKRGFSLSQDRSSPQAFSDSVALAGQIRRYLVQQYKLTETTPIEQFLRDEGYRQDLTRDRGYVLTKNGQPVDLNHN